MNQASEMHPEDAEFCLFDSLESEMLLMQALRFLDVVANPGQTTMPELLFQIEVWPLSSSGYPSIMAAPMMSETTLRELTSFQQLVRWEMVEVRPGQVLWPTEKGHRFAEHLMDRFQQMGLQHNALQIP